MRRVTWCPKFVSDLQVQEFFYGFAGCIEGYH
jgi:hypothetical protein